MIDLHIHSTFSPDGTIDIDDICREAIRRDIDVIAITDHVDWDWPLPDAQLFEIPDIDAYFAAIESAAEKYRGRLRVLKGVELGLQAHLLSRADAFVRSYDFDFVIASVHLAGGLDPYDAVYFDGRTKEESYRLYYQTVLDLISEFDAFDTLGHLDYVRRRAPYPSDPGDDAMELMDRILTVLAKKNKALEINTSGLHAPLGETMPSPRIWKRFMEMGGRMLTVGSDAHLAEHIGYGLSCVYERLGADAGHLYYFQNRIPQQAL